jgi:hypothetical protein
MGAIGHFDQNEATARTSGWNFNALIIAASGFSAPSVSATLNDRDQKQRDLPSKTPLTLTSAIQHALHVDPGIVATSPITTKNPSRSSGPRALATSCKRSFTPIAA